MRARRRLIPLAVLPILALAPVTPAAAGTARPADYYPTSAYLWSSLKYYSYNSTGEDIIVNAVGTGRYQVSIDGLASVAGKAIVEVTPYNSTNTCSVQGWGSSGRYLVASVDCYTAVTGVAATTEFDLVVTHPVTTPHGVFDYAFNNRATSSGTLHGYQYNSSRDANKVQHLGTGKYQITFVGPKSAGMRGTVKVSPYGAGPGDCGPVSWHGTKHGEIVRVNCYAPAGALENRDFMVTYASANNLLGQSGIAGANALANRPATHTYAPSVQYNSERHAVVSVRRFGAGLYEVTFKGSEGTPSNGGDVQVNSVGNADVQCSVEAWTQEKNPVADVSCTNELGTFHDSAFEVNWVVG